MTPKLRPKDHGEEVALFRVQVLGPVLNRELQRGELLAELRVLATRRFRPPGNSCTRVFSVPTLLRWHRRYRKEGLDGLRPASRRVGDALALTDNERELLLQIRREHPAVPANVILDTLLLDGRLERGRISAQTLRRFYRRHDLGRLSKSKANRPRGERRRWEAGHVGELWHADVCHGPTLTVGDKRIPLRIHALLDDKSRYVVMLRVFDNEREASMLELMLGAIRSYGGPLRLYLDNGSTYRGEALQTACGRLDINLLHASPYDPQARGKMERFWRTMRDGCLSHMGNVSSVHAVQVRLLAWLRERYHKAPHASLIGRSPTQAWAERQLRERTDDELACALTIREQRRVRTDCTVAIGNVDWEVSEAFLAGRKLTVARTLAHAQRAPWIEHDDRVYTLRPVDAVANGRRRKRKKPKPGLDAVDFDPVEVLLDHAMGRLSRHGGVR